MLTSEQQAIRSKGIGASETAALLGLDPYKKPIDIYMKKVGLVEDVKSHHIDRGNYLEPALRQWAIAKTGIMFGPGSTHIGDGHLIATPDGECAPDFKHCSSVLELKSPGPRTAWEWQDGEEAPDRYVVQLAQQQLVTGAPDGYLAALVDGDLRTYHFKRDPELEGVIIEAVERFWKDHIEKQIPPPVDGSPSASEYLKKIFPRNNGELLTADSKTEGLIIALKDAKQAEKEASERLELIEQQLKSIIGEKDGLTSPFGKISWRCNKDGTRIDWESIAKELKPSAELITKFTVTKPGPRVFRPSFAK